MYDDQPKQTTLPRPDVITELAKVISRCKPTTENWPDGMPLDPRSAAQWWVRHQALRAHNEQDELKETTPKKAYDEPRQYWSTPYLDRLRLNVRKFLRLSSVDQKIIIGCAEEKIFWRGDDMDIFYHRENSIYNENLKMREMGIKAYRAETIAKMRSLNLFAD